MSDPTKEKIDFRQEAIDAGTQYDDCNDCRISHAQCEVVGYSHLLEWAKSIAERVEEQTIQRSLSHSISHIASPIKRLYAQQSGPEESE